MRGRGSRRTKKQYDILHWNSRGIKNKRSEAQILLDLCKAQVLCLGETKIPAHENFVFSGFEVFLKNKVIDPQSIAHGGVAILARKEVAPVQVKLNTHFQAVAVSVKLHKRITIVSIYIPPGVGGDFTEGELEKLIDQLPKPYMILGDFNAKNTLWFDEEVDGRGTIIENVLIKKDCYFLDQDHDTYFNSREGQRTSSHIDLSLCSLELLQDFEWGVYNDLMGSDHFPIWLRSGRQSRPQRYPKWIMQKADWNKFQEEAKPRMDINEFDSANEANTYVTGLFIDAAKQSIPKTSGRGGSYSAIWFDEECYEAKRKRQEAFNNWRYGIGPRGAWKKECAIAHKVFRKVKRRSWKDFIQGINEDELGDLWRRFMLISNAYTDKGVLALKVGGRVIDDRGEMAEAIADKIEEVSSEASCSPEFLSYRHRAERKKIKFSLSQDEPYNVPIRRVELDAALSALKKNSCPGPDDIHNQMLKNLPEEAKDMLLDFLNKVFLEGDFPEDWRLAHVIPLLKEGKDPLDPGSYRPISLTSCLCKLLEKIMDIRFMWFLAQQQVIDPVQCGGLKGKGTIDCLVALENEIHEAFLKNRLLVSLFIDLEKAYQTAWQYLVLKELHEAGLRGNLGRFISEFMRDRKFQVRVGNKLSSVHNLDLGVPQGSVLSVKLFLIAVNTVIRFIPDTISRSIYVDDFRLSIAVEDLARAKRAFDGVCKKLQVWMKVTGFRISLTKTKVVVFHNRPEKGKYPVLDFAFEIGLPGAIFEVVRRIRVLGVIFDQRLTWVPQSGEVRRVGFLALNAMKVMAKGNGRTNRETYLMIYKAVVLPKIDYGCEVYGTAKEWILKRLDPIHHAALRLCLGAFRSSRSESLYVEAYIPSLWDRRDYLRLCYMYRAQRIPIDQRFSGWEDNSLDDRYQRLKRKPKSFGFLTRKVRDELQLGEPHIKTFRLYDMPPWCLPCLNICFSLESITKREMNDVVIGQLFREHKHEVDIEIYTDGSKRCEAGSKTKGRVGSGVYITGGGMDAQLKERLGDFASVFTAELVAIRMALIELRESQCKRCVIYSDSRSALQALQVYNSDHGLVQDIQELVYELEQNLLQITFCWVPSHVSTIDGNNIADDLAKGAANLPGRDGARPLVFFSDWKAHIRERIFHRWREAWTDLVDDKWTQLRGVQSFIAPRKWGRGLSRLEDRKITRLRIGHTMFARDYYFTGAGPPECEECGEPLTVQHLLLECVAYNHQRRTLFQGLGELTLSNLLGVSEGGSEETDRKFKVVLTFFRDIEYFSRI